MPRNLHEQILPYSSLQTSNPLLRPGKALVAVLLAVLIAAVVGGAATVAVLLVRAEEQRKADVRRVEERRSDEIRIEQLDRVIDWTIDRHDIDGVQRMNTLIVERNELFHKWPELHRVEQKPIPIEK